MNRRAFAKALFAAAALALAFVPAADAQETQSVRIGSVSVTLPLDAAKTDSWTRTAPMRIERTARWHSKSIQSTVTVSYVEYQETLPAPQRLVRFLHTFMENYGTIDHLVSIEEGGYKGINIKAQILNDVSGIRYTYVESRVFASKDRLYCVTVETMVNTTFPDDFKNATNVLTEIFASMKVR